LADNVLYRTASQLVDLLGGMHVAIQGGAADRAACSVAYLGWSWLADSVTNGAACVACYWWRGGLAGLCVVSSVC
jgi:hypothetical protein